MDKFTETYLNIICETWDRYQINDIVRATGIITNGYKDQWVKGETGRAVLDFLNKAGDHSRGKEWLRGSAFIDKDDLGNGYVGADDVEYAKANNIYYDGSANFDLRYAANYWKSRAKSESEFDIQTSAAINRWVAQSDRRGPKGQPVGLTALDVGRLAYAIWKALNARTNKIERNLQEFEENGSPYNEGEKVENIDLKIIRLIHDEFQATRWSKSTTTHVFMCEDSKTGFKVKVRLGKNSSEALFSFLQSLQYDKAFDDPKFDKYKQINVSGKVSKLNKEYKSVTLNYVTINSPTDTEVEQARDEYVKSKNEAKEKPEIKGESDNLAKKNFNMKFLTETFPTFPEKDKESLIPTMKKIFSLDEMKKLYGDLLTPEDIKAIKEFNEKY